MQYGDGTTQKTPSECVKNVKRVFGISVAVRIFKEFQKLNLESPASLGPRGCGSKSGIFETWLTCSQRQTGTLRMFFSHHNSWLQCASLGSDWESSAGQSLCSEGEQHTVSRENCPSQVRRNPSFNKKCSLMLRQRQVHVRWPASNCSVGNFAKGGEPNFQQLRCTPATHLTSP